MPKRSAAADESLDGIAIIRTYMDRVISADGQIGAGSMKVLLLDGATTQILSAVYSQTEILNQQVYLVSRIDTKADEKNSSSSSNSSSTNHLTAVCFIRPTAESMDAVGRELSRPRFREYHIFVSGILAAGLLRQLASHDVHERVRQVKELYADFLPLNADLWTLQQQGQHCLAMTVAAGTSWAPKHAVQYERNLAGLQAMLLACKRQPAAIRYAAQSPCAEELAKDLHDAIQQDEIFHFRQPQRRTKAMARGAAGVLNGSHKKGGVASGIGGLGSTTGGGLHVLVLDRRDDPVTPLLSQWTYQAMVHELLGLNNHRVILRGAPNVSKDLEEVVLNSTQDEFFRTNRHKNFGELGEEIQRMLKEYQRQTAQHNAHNLNSIEEMQNFMDKFPELRSRSHHVSKHVAIMGELARLVEACSLMDVSQFEQELACADDHNTHWRQLMEKLQSHEIKIPDKLRLALLYALRYEVSANLHMVQSAMSKGGVPPDMVQLLPVLLRYGGTKSRGPGLYGEDNHNIMSKMTKSLMTSVQGVQNVYSQHVPLVMDTLQSLAKGKLSTRTHPIVPGSATTAASAVAPPSAAIRVTSGGGGGGGIGSSGAVPPEHVVPEEVLIFMVGGVTYEEATKIHEFNESQKAIQVVLAGSTVHNSTSFLDELRSTSL